MHVPHPLILDLGGLALLLKVTADHARQVVQDARFPSPVADEPRHLWNRDDVERWIRDSRWWETEP